MFFGRRLRDRAVAQHRGRDAAGQRGGPGPDGLRPRPARLLRFDLRVDRALGPDLALRLREGAVFETAGVPHQTMRRAL